MRACSSARSSWLRRNGFITCAAGRSAIVSPLGPSMLTQRIGRCGNRRRTPRASRSPGRDAGSRSSRSGSIPSSHSRGPIATWPSRSQSNSRSDRVAESGSTMRMVATPAMSTHSVGNGGSCWYEEGMSGMRVLVVDDDDDIRNLVRTLLERTGTIVHDAPNGRDGLREFHAWRPDLVILDVNMPELDGWAVLERIRDMSEVPVLMLTARGEELERVRGLQAGADDYVVKPFGKQELVARVQALVRRASRAGPEQEADAYSDAYLSIDWTQARVSVGDRELQLTPLEFRLLSTFVRHPRQVLSRDQLLELVWGDAFGVGGDQVKLYVGYLRRKLDPDAPETVPIETVRGFGYRYKGP